MPTVAPNKTGTEKGEKVANHCEAFKNLEAKGLDWGKQFKPGLNWSDLDPKRQAQSHCCDSQLGFISVVVVDTPSPLQITHFPRCAVDMMLARVAECSGHLCLWTMSGGNHRASTSC